MTRAAKVRADVALVARGLADSRARAQALIMAGLVTSGDRRIDKAGAQLPADAELVVRRPDHPWVSRGGVKLAHGLEHFAIDPANRHGIRLRRRYGKDRDSLFTFMTTVPTVPTFF